MKVLESVKGMRKVIKVYNRQFGFMAGRSTTDAIFIVHQLQEKYLVKKKDLWMLLLIWRKHLIGCLEMWFGGH